MISPDPNHSEDTSHAVAELKVQDGRSPSLLSNRATKGEPAKITLVRPPILQLPQSLSAFGAILPIGLAYVAAALRDAGHDIRVIDAPGEALDRFASFSSPIGPLQLNGLTAEEIVDRIEPDTEILGITHMFLHEWPMIREIAEGVKAKIPGIKVVLGGENATAFWKWIFQESDAVDYCVLGEGEATMLELTARIKAGLPTDDIQGLAGRVSGGSNGDGGPQLPQRLTQLNEIPRPAWEYFPVERYMEAADNHGVNRGRAIPMLATRGCPYQCTFCSSPQMWTTKYQTREPADVVDEMKYYVERYRINNVNFCDLTAIIQKEWIVEFCQILKRENLGITWQLPTGTRTEALDEEVLDLVYETGCRNITYAPESGSNRVLRILKKRVKLPRMLDSLQAARRRGIISRVNIIIGHPREERRDLWQTLQFLIRAALKGCEDASVMMFGPYPGSEDFFDLLKDGKVDFGDDYYYLALARSGFSTKTYNPRIGTPELVLIQYTMLATFYSVSYLSRPWRILNLIASQITGNERTNVDQTLRTKRTQLAPLLKRTEVPVPTRAS
jgi:radical SAM superfamily enzyme YgiQ (UPF0313 family)